MTKKNQLGTLHILLEIYTSVETIFFEYHNFFQTSFCVIKLNWTEYFCSFIPQGKFSHYLIVYLEKSDCRFFFFLPKTFGLKGRRNKTIYFF